MPMLGSVRGDRGQGGGISQRGVFVYSAGVTRRAFWVCLYAAAMAAVESAVVVYLRALHPVDAPVAALLAVIPDRLTTIEVGREAGGLAIVAIEAPNESRGVAVANSVASVRDRAYTSWQNGITQSV